MKQMKKICAQIAVVVYHVSIAASGYGFWTSCNKLGSTSCSEFPLFETMQTRFEFLCTLCRIETRYGYIPDGCEAGREGRRRRLNGRSWGKLIGGRVGIRNRFRRRVGRRNLKNIFPCAVA